MQTDSVIFNKLKNGEAEAFDWVYNNCYHKATAFIRKHNGSEQDAEDFFQEALFVLVEKLRDPHFELHASCASYLYVVVRNLWVYHQRKAGRVIPVEADQLQQLAEQGEADFVQVLEEARHSEQQHQQVAAAFRQLGEDCQQLLLLRFYENKDDAEIASIMKYQKDFVKVKRFRCLNKLREILQL